MNNKGQAALVDSVLFLTIIMSISAGFLFFTINYGSQTQNQLSSFYSSDFSADVLKIVTYINVARDGSLISSQDLEGSDFDDFELDYLLVLIKEDYADSRSVTQRTQNAIKNTFESALKPFQASMDYVFYLYNEETNEYFFLLFSVHECVEYCDVEQIQTRVGLVSRPNPNMVIENRFYFCQPDGRNNFLEKELFPTLGKVDSAFGKVTLPVSLDSAGMSFVMGLHIWVVTNSDKISEIGDGSADLNCELL